MVTSTGQRIDVSSDVTQPEWDAFVETHPNATSYHLWNWRHVFERAFAHRTEYLAARTDGAIVGVLPLVLFKNWFFGSFLVSLPFVNYGGVLADDDVVARALLARAGELARPRGVAHLELRHRSQRFEDLPARRHKVSMIK